MRVANAHRPFQRSIAWNIVKFAWNKRECTLFGVNARLLAWTTGPKIRIFSAVYVPDFFIEPFFAWTLSAPYHLDHVLCVCWLKLPFTKDATKSWECRPISCVGFGPTNPQAFDFKLVELFVEQGFAKLSWEMKKLARGWQGPSESCTPQETKVVNEKKRIAGNSANELCRCNVWEN